MIKPVVQSVVRPAVNPVQGGGGVSWSSYWTSTIFNDTESFDNGKVNFQFDDGFIDNYTVGLPLFQSKGVPATFFLQTISVGLNGNYMTWANALEMHNAGMDMQCHRHDSSSDFTTLTNEEIATDMVQCNLDFTSHGLPAPEHHALPGGSYNDRVLDVLDGYRKTVRTTSTKPNLVAINRKSGKYLLAGPGGTIAVLKAQMDVAKINKTALILWSHRIDVPGWGFTSAELIELIDYAVLIGLDIITMSEIYESMFYIDLRLSRPLATDNQIDISCKNKLRAGISISIERSDDEGVTYSEIHVLGSGETEYSDTGLTLNKNYFYRVRAFRGTYYAPYSRVAYTSTAITLGLTATGTGLGVATLRLQCEEPVLLTLDGTAKFYSDAAGTLDESSTYTAYGLASIYIRCPSGTANLKISKNSIYNIETWTSSTNAPSLTGDISKLTALELLGIVGNNTLSGDVSKLIHITTLNVQGSNTLSGNVAGLTNLTYLYVTGSNTITGSVTNLTKLTFIRVQGSNTLSGNVAGLVLLTQLYVLGSNTLTGSITNLTLLTYLRVTGTNTLSGDVTLLTSLTYIYVLGQNTLTGSVTNLTSLTVLYCECNNNTLSGSIDGLTNLLGLYVSGLNIITGNLRLISSKLTYCLLSPCRVVDYTAGGDWSKILASQLIYVNPSVGYGMSSAEVDLFLQEISATKVEGRAIIVQLKGSNGARTAASDAAVADIVADGGSVQTN